MKANIAESSKKRIVIVGGGFGGLKLARELANSNYQIVLLDKNNYHQFQPLYYQVATAGLEPSAIAFPFRKIFQKATNISIRVAEVYKIITSENKIETDIGIINYDYLIIAIGADTNFFGNTKLIEKAKPMKSVSEALALRNTILQNYEAALTAEDEDTKTGLLNIVVVGGGPTGVEVSGSMAEMKKFVLPKDYPEIDFNKMQIHLLEGGPKLLGPMSEQASKKAKEYLEELGVEVSFNTVVKDYDGKNVLLANGDTLRTDTLVWAAGVIGNKIEGISNDVLTKANRIKVDAFNKVEGTANVYAIGDIALMSADIKFAGGHPQVAQVAIQQANLLAKNLLSLLNKKPLKPFKYKDLGSMATVGRNKAVADLPGIKFQGFFAWLIWMFIHLMSIVGVKNRILIFINWAWSYATYDQSLRLIIKQKPTVKNKNKTL
jgi:NADH dehydrogenase